VLVPAYLEKTVIAAKVADVLANGYPGPLEVVVVAEGDTETAGLARQAGATVLSSGERLGKSQALNLGLSKIQSPFVVLSDANCRLSPGAIAAMVCHFSDPKVGAVAGEKVESDPRESLYWRFESWLKRHEWRLGTTIGLVGELAAIRTEAWHPIPQDIATDDLWTALDMCERGYSVAYEPRARATDPPTGSLREQWERRTRSVSGALHVFARRRSQLGRAGGLVAVEIWGHRLVRYTAGPLAHAVLVVLALVRCRPGPRARRGPVAGVFLAAHVLGAAAIGRRALDTSSQPDPVSAALGQVIFLDTVALGGMLRYLRGDRRTLWRKVER
jgi:hypothetical protein